MSMSKTIGWMGTLATLLLVPSLFGPVARYRLHAAPVGVATPTYTKDIAPILQRSCENCHRAGRRRADVPAAPTRRSAPGRAPSSSAPASARTPA